MPEEKARLVYSTGRVISRKEKPAADGVKPPPGPSVQRVIVRLDRKRRGGKSVTVMEGPAVPVKDREALLRRLKAGLGTGGTIKGSSIEIQGDHCDALIATLTEMGYKPKRSGG
ncbi:MAG: translation initiation factor [Nitrospiraceae bacterium]|nr:translation initiation factor [Nitrospiraceae bacterium]